jgi:hypothetical protein
MIDNSINLAQSSESYFYIFYKLKKLDEANSQINTIILGYSNNIFSRDADELIFGDASFGYKFPKYSQLITWHDKFFLLSQNPDVYLKSSLDALKSKNKLAVSKVEPIFRSFNWGGYEYIDRSEIAKLLLEKEKNIDNAKPAQKKVTEYNIIYLKKILEYSKLHHIKVILLRTPLHRAYQREHEDQLMALAKSYNKDVQFWDYSQFPLDDSDFIDFSHLNYKGAYKFSQTLAKDLRKNAFLESF